MRYILRAAAVVVMVLGTSAVAQSRPSGAAGRDGAPGQRMVQMRLDSMREAVNSLDLSTDQKKRVDEVFEKASTQIKSKTEEMDKDQMSMPDRMAEGRQVFTELREQIEGILNEQQRQAFGKKMDEMQQRMRGGGQGPGGAGRGEMLGRMREMIDKLDLSEDQKKQMEKAFGDMRDKMQTARSQAKGDQDAMREKMRPIMKELQEQIKQTLTADQAKKLRDEMQQNMDGGGAGQGRQRERGPATRPQKRIQDDTKVEKKDQAMGPEGGGGPAVGEPAPNFEIKRLDGRPVQLSFFKGRLLVLVFASYSTPAFREKAAALEQLFKDHGRLADFLLVYTKEAYPAGSRDVERNKKDGISIEQPANEANRKEAGMKAKMGLKLTIPMAVDSMDDAAANAYRLTPNGVAIIGRDSTIAFRQKWLEPYALGLAIEQVAKARAATSHPADMVD